MRLIALFALIAVTGTTSTLPAAGEAERLVEYDCNEIVVVGRLKNDEDSYEHVDIENDILGHGWITAQVRIKRVLAGKERRRKVQARYFAHTYRVEDREFLMVLRPANGGPYTAHSFVLTPGPKRPKLVSSCASR